MTTGTSVAATHHRAAGGGTFAHSSVATDATGQVTRGILLAVLAMFLYALMDAFSKALVAKFDPSQIIIVRTVLALALGITMALAREGIRAALVTRQPVLQLARGYCATACMYAALGGLALLPLADAVTIMYSAPIVATLLAIPILGETIGWRRLAAVFVGFVGVVIVARPGGDTMGWGLVLALVGMLLYALCTNLTRRLGRTDSGLTTHIYTQFCFLSVALPLSLFVWVAPSPLEALLLLCAGLAGALGIYLITLAGTMAPPAAVAPADYTVILWGALLGMMIWGDIPDTASWLGMAIIAASGLYIAQREFVTSPLNRTGSWYLWARRHRPL